MMIMTEQRMTFAGWLGQQSDRPQSDPVGWLAGAWGSFSGPDRPRLSSPVSIGRYLSEHGSQEAEWQGWLSQAVEAATLAYRQAMEQPASQPADQLQVAEQQARDAIERMAAEPSPEMVSDAVDRVADAHPGPAMSLAPPPDAGYTGSWAADTLGAQLDRIEALLGMVMQMLAASFPPAAQLLLEHVAGSPAAQEVITMAEARTELQDTAREVAERNGWLAAPDQQMLQLGGFEAWWNAAEPAGESDG